MPAEEPGIMKKGWGRGARPPEVTPVAVTDAKLCFTLWVKLLMRQCSVVSEAEVTARSCR